MIRLRRLLRHAWAVVWAVSLGLVVLPAVDAAQGVAGLGDVCSMVSTGAADGSTDGPDGMGHVSGPHCAACLLAQGVALPPVEAVAALLAPLPPAQPVAALAAILPRIDHATRPQPRGPPARA